MNSPAMGYSERMALRVVSAALCAQLASGTFCNHEVQTASQSDDHAEGEPHRVLVLIIPLFIIFYSIVMGLFYLVYGCLRKGPATEFAVLVEQGRVVEDDLDKDEAKIEPLNTDGWWSKSLQDIHKEVRALPATSLHVADIGDGESDCRRMGSMLCCTSNT